MKRGVRIPIPAAILLLAAGCARPEPPPAPSPAAPVPLAIHRPEVDFRVFPGADEVPPASFRFEGAGGYVRATMEVETAIATGTTAPRPQVNDVIFPVRGEGTLSILFRRPAPGQHGGRVVIRCRSGEAESEAEFEPVLWFDQPASIVTFESKVGDPASPAVEGREILLARYVARNAPNEIRLAFKAVFSPSPIAPRVKVGQKDRP